MQLLTFYALGRRGVQQAREASHSALPDAPVIPDRQPRQPRFRVQTADALHQLADWIGPVDARTGHGRPQQV